MLFAIAFTVFQAISEKIIALFLYKIVLSIFNHAHKNVLKYLKHQE